MEDEKNNELIGKLRVMNKQELDKFIVRYRIHPNTLLACEEFIIKGARALVDIQRQLTRHYSNHVILNIIKSMPFYAPFHSMYCPEYNPYANIDELRSAVRHYDMFYANDSTAEELRDKINNAMSLNINTGAMFFKSKIKLYLRFIHFAQQNDVNIDSPKQYKNYTKISAILRLYYRTPSILDKKITNTENAINSITSLIKDTRKRLFDLKNKEHELQLFKAKKLKRRQQYK